MRSSEHAANRLLMHSVLTSHLWLNLGLHPCMRTCVLFFERLSSPVFLLPRPVPLPALPDVQLDA